MAFEARDFLDLVRLLEERPEWRAELRRLLLTDELLSLPQLVRELAEAQRRTEERVGRLEERANHFEEEMAKLIEAQRLTNEALRALAESHQRLAITVGEVKGRILEQAYREKAAAYFGRLVRRLRVMHPYELEESLRAHISEGEFFDLLHLDLLVRGQPRELPELPELWLAVEISSVIDIGDVERAERRAMILRRAGYPVIPVVAGEQITAEAKEAARHRGILVLRDGHASHWEEAVRI
jgi:hypothetical protein